MLDDEVYGEIPRELIAEAEHFASAAFVEARSITPRNVHQTHEKQLLGANRHALFQKQLPLLGKCAGLDAITYTAGPSGYEIPALVSGNFLILGAVAKGYREIRRRPFRLAICAANESLEPVQPSLLDEAAALMPLNSRRVAYLFPVRSPRAEMPACVMFGVPTADLRGWHFLKQVTHMLAEYDQRSAAVDERPARVRLRQVPLSKRKD